SGRSAPTRCRQCGSRASSSRWCRPTSTATASRCCARRRPCEPYGPWMQQVARNLTDGVDGFLHGKRYLIHDRDPLFTKDFRDTLKSAGVTCLKLPAKSPNLNAYAERFILSIKAECLDKLVPLDERHLR